MRAESQRQESGQGRPGFPVHTHLLQLIQEETEAFPGHSRDQKVLLGIPHQRGVHEASDSSVNSSQQFFSEFLVWDRAPHSISQVASNHPAEETHIHVITQSS
ncbi:hypothetical protein WMY93_012089 [Mugilogobius chulae]|uniref:Uncharacterized protein n=1 Tax=Mugilogobius chulae TaxID=88201 RepID=A0AAW0PGL8_9GOBI